VMFRSGANALISAILATPFVGRFALYGSNGWAEVVESSHPDSPMGWTLTTCSVDGRQNSTRYPMSSAVLANLMAFADAVEGRAAYPMPQDQMVATIAALEACFRSAASGHVETVEA
jgi:predicted dehydrogenase